jgi:hypothetical protein
MSAHRITWSELIIAAALSTDSDTEAQSTLAIALAQQGQRRLCADRRRPVHREGARRCEEEINEWLARSVSIVGGTKIEN